MSDDLFKLQGTITVENTAANSAIDETTEKAKAAGEALDQTGTSAGGAGEALEGMIKPSTLATAQAMGTAMYALAVNTGRLVVNLSKKAIEAAATIEAENAQFASTFSDLADVATASFDSISKDTNIYAGRLKSVGIKAYGQFKGSGIEAAESIEMMDEYLRIAADAAAYYDITLEEADTRLRSFLRGNTEAGDSIGLFTSATQRDTYALEKYGAEWKELTEAQRQMLLLDVASNIYEQSGALGQAAREGSAWANVMGNLSRIWEEILARLGGPIIEQLIPRIEKFSQWLADNPELVDGFAEAISELLGAVLDGVESLIQFLNSERAQSVINFFARMFGVNEEWVAAQAEYEQYQTAKADQEQLSHENKGVVGGLLGKYAHWNEKQITAATLYASAYANNSGTDWAKEQLKLVVTDEEMQSVIADIETLFKTYENPLEITSLMFTDEAEAEFQEMVSEIPLSAEVSLTPKYGLSGLLDNLFGSGQGSGEGKPHANGLDRVPYDGYQAILHRNEMVLTAREADIYRAGGSGTDTSRLESLMQEVLNAIHDIAGIASTKQSIVLDTGVMVGQLAPGINAHLGILSKRGG